MFIKISKSASADLVANLAWTGLILITTAYCAFVLYSVW
jgi:hypothetical protein